MATLLAPTVAVPVTAAALFLAWAVKRATRPYRTDPATHRAAREIGVDPLLMDPRYSPEVWTEYCAMLLEEQVAHIDQLDAKIQEIEQAAKLEKLKTRHLCTTQFDQPGRRAVDFLGAQ